ncbi:MAG TPA: antibiotic biosynthesis monooxygenase [Terriglobales bacterium]|nr:antibiotic biosynthesis monooxygenase [Terriglobales bacterium]
MIHVLWEFQVPQQKCAEFEKAYKSDGVWSQLFRRHPAYVKTILVRDSERKGCYLTIDVWKNRESYLEFKHRFAADYAKIDKSCEALTDSEGLIGVFEELV